VYSLTNKSRHQKTARHVQWAYAPHPSEGIYDLNEILDEVDIEWEATSTPEMEIELAAMVMQLERNLKKYYKTIRKETKSEPV